MGITALVSLRQRKIGMYLLTHYADISVRSWACGLATWPTSLPVAGSIENSSCWRSGMIVAESWITTCAKLLQLKHGQG